MKVVAAITDPVVVMRILRHVGLFDQPRAPNVHDCPSPPVDSRGQTLLIFPARPGKLQCRTMPEPVALVEDPRLQYEWPVDPPFEDD